MAKEGALEDGMGIAALEDGMDSCFRREYSQLL